jgi:hypothetical protein
MKTPKRPGLMNYWIDGLLTRSANTPAFQTGQPTIQ